MDPKKLSNRIVPLDVFKLTPRNNCGQCAQKTCLAFSTMVVVGQENLESCPYIDKEKAAAFLQRLNEQLEAGIGVSRESFEKTMKFLQAEVKKWDFKAIAESLGAEILDLGDALALKFPYFGDPVTVTRSDIGRDDMGGLSPWEKIFIYNYVIGGATQLTGVWVGMESLPNSVSKIKSLQAHCEKPLADAFAGRMQKLSAAVSRVGTELSLEDQGVDFAAEFQVLPMLVIRLLFWDEAEDYPCRVKFLFDSRVLQIVDLESLIFASEQITDRLISPLTPE